MQLKLLTVSLFCVSLFLSSETRAQSPAFRAGVVNVKEIIAQPDGSAKMIYEVRQQLEGDTVNVLPLAGTKPYSLEKELPDAAAILDLTGDIYTNLKFLSDGGASKNSLTPSTVQDGSLGCRSASFPAYDRIAGLKNKSLSSADFSVGAAFSIVDNSKRNAVCSSGVCSVYAQTFPAPNYSGPLYFEATLDQIASFDLLPHIRNGSGGVTCSLYNTKNQHGIAGTGLSENPAGLSVSEDCKVTIDTSTSELGQKYAFRTVITSKYADPSCKNSYTTLDLIYQISCKAGDLACLQCQNFDYGAVSSATDNAFKEILRSWEFALAKATTSDPIAKKRVRRSQKKLTSSKKLIEELSAQVTGFQPAASMHCARPSSLFCKTSDANQMVGSVLINMTASQKSAKQALNALRKQSGLKKKDAAAVKTYTKNIKVTANKARNLINLMPKVINYCQ